MDWRRWSPESKAHTGSLRRARRWIARPTAPRWLPIIATLLATPGVATGQSFFGFGGVEVRGGRMEVKQADLATNVAFESDLGYVAIPELRSLLGFNYFSGDVGTTSPGQSPAGAGGSMRSMGAEASLRWDIRPRYRLTPYVLGGATYDYVRSEAGDAAVDSRLEGGHLGGLVGAGVALRLGAKHQRWSITGDFRFVTSKDMGRALAAIGLRYSPRGQAMYDRDEIPWARPTTIIDGPPGRAPPP